MIKFQIKNMTAWIEKFPLILCVFALIFFAVIVALFYRNIFLKKRAHLHIDHIGSSHPLNAAESDQHMKALAEIHQNVKYRRYNFIVGVRNQKAYDHLNEIRLFLENASSDIISLIPAARWIFDNFYMMHRELKKIKTTGTSQKKLPIITDGEFVGYPRIYVVAREMVRISNGHLNSENIRIMMQTYQSITPLTSVELWSLQEMLGFCLLESILSVSDDIIRIIKTKAAADDFVREKLSEKLDGSDISVLLSEGMSSEYASDNIFHSHVIYCLKSFSVDESQIQRYVEIWAGDKENLRKPSDIFSKEGRFESDMESVIRALIMSLRNVNEINGVALFEGLSPIENKLMQDPARVYGKMDSETRSQYRREVETLALKYKISEHEIAEKVVVMATENKNDTLYSCSDHIGTYLIGKGKAILLAAITGQRVSKKKQNRDELNITLYFSSIIIFIVTFLWLLVRMIEGAGYWFDDPGVSSLFVLLVFPLIGIAIELSNLIFAYVLPVKGLPSLDFLNEIPDEFRTFVVMPVIFLDAEHVVQYVNNMEKHYLSNRQNNLYFAVLGDFADAPNRVLLKDNLILSAAKEAIQALNKKYPSSTLRFSLFIRHRSWNESEGCWMGWERKRGKLEEFNALLCGEADTTFSMILGDEERLNTFKYVITLDSGTDLILDSAAKFIGILAHPLNRPIIDPKTNKIREGYAIIQPIIENHIFPDKNGFFSRIFAGQSGLDPYSKAVSDIYQDIFREGIFKGKGIYDVNVLHQILYKTFPENSVLSHDLLESTYVRCAFSSKVIIMDDHPSSVLSYTKREHRWIRGDWQLLPWLFGNSPINGVSRWKIFDNLRRSMNPILQLSAILFNALLLPEAFYLWVPIVFFNSALCLVMIILNTLIQKLMRPKLEIVFFDVVNELFNSISEAMISFILMPYRAWIAMDAIVRTLFRLMVSHKHLLQWETAEVSELKVKINLRGYYASMWIVVLPCTFMGWIVLTNDAGIPAKISYVLLTIVWMSSPTIAYLISRPRNSLKVSNLNIEDKRYLRLLARRTWQYFDDFLTEENNWLCPDNYQLAPSSKVTDKTSPTNIGLQLTSIMAARDLGYTGLLSMVDDYENVLYTVAVLPKWNGHLYNWYNIKTLEIVNPFYVSTVDSGNFIGHVIALKNGLMDVLDQPVFPKVIVDGILDVIQLTDVEVEIPLDEQSVAEFMRSLQKLIESLENGDQKTVINRKWYKVLQNNFGELLRDYKAFGTQDASFEEQKTLRMLANDGSVEANILVERLNGLVLTLDNLINHTSFKELFNDNRQLFHIGYHVSSQKMDDGCYDLVASESSLTSFLAIAKGEVMIKHWFKLGRPLTMIRGKPAFVSWSGSMFEYLMPNLVMKEFRGSVFSQTARAAILQHRIYAKKMKIPWGISESQYYRFDLDSNYQYKAFGVPKLQLQPVLNVSRVVAPYATLLALPLAPREALDNMYKLDEMGAAGEYGFYEAIDFNGPDPITMKPYSIVKCFMAHHQGMVLISINNTLSQNIMQKRFHNEPIIKAAEVLLGEKRNTNLIAITRKGYNIQIKELELPETLLKNRYINSTALSFPRAHWLSNENYSVMVTSDGDGFSRYKNMMLNRWRSDVHASSGSYIYICSVGERKYWSATYKPTCVEPEQYQAIFSHHQMEFVRRDGDLTTHTTITLSPTLDVEIRKVTMTNHGDNKAVIEMTSYQEVVADQFLSELSHPAFSKLFIESEYIPDYSMLLCKRRNSAGDENLPYLLHMVKTDAEMWQEVEYETDRLRFLGRNNTVENPEVVAINQRLSNAAGFSVDPILSLRMSIVVPASKSVSVSFITGVCLSHDDAVKISEEFNDTYRIQDVIEKFRLQSELELKYLNIHGNQLNAFQDLIGPLFYPSAPYRGLAESIRRNWMNQKFLWRFGVSGDHPILLLKVNSLEEAGIIKNVLKFYEYLRINNVKVDLILLVEAQEGYRLDLTTMLTELTSRLKVYDDHISKPSLFILHTNQMETAEVDLLLTVARIVFSEKTGIYFRQAYEGEITQKNIKRPRHPSLIERKSDQPIQTNVADESAGEFFNGFGRFVNNGTEYEIMLDESHRPPKPWINVIANDQFGFQVSETGAGFTWSVNSRENKITSWSNDPVTDPAPEVLYIRDDLTGKVFSPISIGSVVSGLYRVRHGFGYSIFEHEEENIHQELLVYVPLDEPVKIWKLSLTNTEMIQRQLSITLYVEWVLGVDRELSAPFIVTSYSDEKGYLSANSVYSYYFRKHQAFMFSSETISAYTGDRREFLGGNGSIYRPTGLENKLSCMTGVGLDPCGVIQIMIVMDPGEKKEIIFGLGQSDNAELVDSLCLKYKDVIQTDLAFDCVKAYWQKITESIVVKSNDRAFDIMANGWLLYQIIACRIKARAAFYQCGGAYGFRDQLQDVLALMDADPEAVRKQILLACSRQFEEGDVQHWWHPPVGVGVRTRITDDLLWLPYVTSKYIYHTGDYSLLEEKVSYLAGAALRPEEHEMMFIPQISDQSTSVYEHCLRAIRHTRYGEHGLPLMGGGDWNDGMNRVGVEGKGESVWLGWFFYAVLVDFLPICTYKNDSINELEFAEAAGALLESIEKNGWDGEWYLRAFYDDGQKLGSIENEECRIDSISQSWSVISGAENPMRSKQALRSADRYLVRAEEGVSLLLAPPFDKTEKNPGYIKNYFPGIRENGGQYTHAAIWLAMANAMIKDCTNAYDLMTLLNPIHITSSKKASMKYGNEPYVMTADISLAEPYVGHGGWSWYTGSASWMYQAQIRWFLGIRRHEEQLIIDPATPPDFGDYTVKYRYGGTIYEIEVKGGSILENNVVLVSLDGALVKGNSFNLVDDGTTHVVLVLRK
jgi:cellobiose phosphorylase